jgi:hypothetical protein
MTAERPARRLLRSPYFWIVAAFAISRVLYFAAGVRFDARPLSSFFQIIDPALMKTRLVESLFYLHTQPPGFNLMIGVVVKLFPVSYAAVLHAIYLLCGLSLCFTMYRLMRILGARPTVAATLTAFFLASPGVVLFENFLMYEYPLMALLCASAVAFHLLLERPGWAPAALFFASLTALVYLRALFHLAWFVLLAAFAGWLLKGRRRMVVAAASVPFLLALGLYVKNEVVFGAFTSSTWMGFNAGTITLHELTPEEHERLIAAGLLSEVGRIDAVDPLPEFRRFITLPPPTGVPILDQLYDSTGRVNYNNPGYLLLHPYYIHDAKEILLHYPRAYLRSVEAAWFAYFLPLGDFPFFDQNHPRIARFDRLFNIVFFGQWKYAPNRKDLRRLSAEGSVAELPLYTGTYLLVGLPLLFCWGLWKLWIGVRGSGWRNPSTAVLAFMLFHIAYITAVVNLLSSFENNRYRLPLDPFFVALLGMAVEAGLSARRPKTYTLDNGSRAHHDGATIDAA